MDRVRDLGIDQDDLRHQLEQAESGTLALNLDEFERNIGEPITDKMVAKTAMYYTFIPAAETLDPSQILKVADRLSEVVRSPLFTITTTVFTTSGTRWSANRRLLKLSRTRCNTCGRDSIIHEGLSHRSFSVVHQDLGRRYS